MNVEENNGVPAQSETPSDDRVEAIAQSAASLIIALPPPESLVATLPQRDSVEPTPSASAEASSGEEIASEADAGPEFEAGAEAAAEEDAPAPEPEPEPEIEFPRLKRHHVAPALIALERIDEDATFRFRPEGDFSQLATDIARFGQLFPVDVRLRPPDRFQVICGFRRVAALRFLQRDRVLARLHTDLSDEEALLMALVSAIHAKPVTAEELAEMQTRLQSEGRLTPAIRNMLEKAISPEDDLAPETVDGGEQEIDAEELANDVTFRLGEINQDLSLLADAFDSLDDPRKDELLKQLRYSSELVAYLEGRR